MRLQRESERQQHGWLGFILVRPSRVRPEDTGQVVWRPRVVRTLPARRTATLVLTLPHWVSGTARWPPQ